MGGMTNFMIYVIAYCMAGIIVVFVGAWITRKYPEDDQDLLEAVEKVSRTAEYQNGTPFHAKSAQILGQIMAFAVGVVGWPLLAVRLFQRLKMKK